MSTDASASYAAEVVRLLWPEPWGPPQVIRSSRRRGLPHRDAYLFPTARQPRLLVPTDLPASSTMLRRLGDERSALRRPMRVVLERSVRSPAFGLARWPILRVPDGGVGADSIETHLAGCFGTDVRVGVVLGPRRANQKPVLPVFDLDGTVLGYAKVGHNQLTEALVRREAQSLAAIGKAAPRCFRAPRVVHHGRWNDLEVLVMTPLATDQRVPVTQAARRAAMREVTGLSGVRNARLAESDFWLRLRRTAGALTPSADVDRLLVAMDATEASDGDAHVQLAGWHGDWGRWNMAVGDGLLQLWDWERYDPAVPMGFDGLHFAAQQVRPGAREERAQEALFLRSVRATLTELDVEPRLHELTLRLYLLEMAVRYLDALTYEATPALTRRSAWVLTLLERLVQPRDITLEVGP